MMKSDDTILNKSVEELLADDQEHPFDEIPPDTGDPKIKLLIQWLIFILFLFTIFVIDKLGYINSGYWKFIISIFSISLILVITILKLKRAKDYEDDIERNKKVN